MDDFRRASVEFGKLVNEAESLLDVAEAKADAAGRQVTRARRLSVDAAKDSNNSSSSSSGSSSAGASAGAQSKGVSRGWEGFDRAEQK
jgi:hypothetical protein